MSALALVGALALATPPGGGTTAGPNGAMLGICQVVGSGEGCAAVTDWSLEKIGERTFRFITSDARQIGYLLDAIEEVVLR